MKKEEGGNENAAFRSDEHSNEIKKTHSHDHDEFPVEILGAEKTFQVSYYVIFLITIYKMTGKHERIPCDSCSFPSCSF